MFVDEIKSQSVEIDTYKLKIKNQEEIVENLKEKINKLEKRNENNTRVKNFN